MTAAMKALQVNLQRAQAFTRIFDSGDTKPSPTKKRGPGKPSKEENELLRAAVIFSLGALDAYLSDVAAEVLITQLDKAKSSPSNPTRAVLGRIAKEIPTLPLELALAGDKQARHEIARQALLDHFGNRVSNHGVGGVASTLERMGQAVDWTAIAVPVALLPASTGNKPPSSSKVLDDWTKVRHGLIHQGSSRRSRAIKPVA